jgi:hypothetical protein
LPIAIETQGGAGADCSVLTDIDGSVHLHILTAVDSHDGVVFLYRPRMIEDEDRRQVPGTACRPQTGGSLMNIATVVFYILVILAFIQMDRRLYDIVKMLRKMTKEG